MSYARLTGTGPPPGHVMIEIIREEGVLAVRQVLNTAYGALMEKMSADRKTGASMRSVYKHVTTFGGEVLGVIGSEYSPVHWLDVGTGEEGPYNQPIVPVEGNWMKFPEPGNSGFRLTGLQRSGRRGAAARWWYAKQVRGIRPRHYFEAAGAVVASRTDLIMEAHAGRAMERIRMAGRKV